RESIHARARGNAIRRAVPVAPAVPQEPADHRLEGFGRSRVLLEEPRLRADRDDAEVATGRLVEGVEPVAAPFEDGRAHRGAARAAVVHDHDLSAAGAVDV